MVAPDRRLRRTRIAVLALVLLVASVLVGPRAPRAQAAISWLDGNTGYTYVDRTACFGSYGDLEFAALTSELVDQTIPSPVIGEVFDVRIVVASIGAACVPSRPEVEIALPPGVTPALTKQVGIRCLYGDIAGPKSPIGNCPTKISYLSGIHPRISKWIDVNPDSQVDPLWPIPQGKAIEIRVPVRSNRRMFGIADTSGCVCVVGRVYSATGIPGYDEIIPENLFDFSRQSPGDANAAHVRMFVFRGKAARYEIPARVRRGAALRKGIPVSTTLTAGGVVHRYAIKTLGGRKLGGAVLKAAAPGKRTVRVRFNRRGRAALRGRIRKLRVIASSTGSGAKPAAKRRLVRVR
jgi:hypothetical protein